MAFEFKPLSIPGLVMIVPAIYRDGRGYFLESYKESEFHAAGITERFVQDNHSRSRKNVLRGLHFQRNPRAQGKLVGIAEGRVFDVAVDIRPNSPTFGRWEAVELSARDHAMIYIPPGFAHGFCVLSEWAHVVYKCTEEYDLRLDAGIRWNDPDIGIKWPVEDPVLSEKDALLPFLKQADLS